MLNHRQKCIVVFLSFFALALLQVPTAFALEQIANGNFGVNLNAATNWSIDNQIDYELLVWGRVNAAGYDAGNGYFHAYYAPPGGSNNISDSGDGAIWQDFPPVARASDTNALISYALREIHTSNGNLWNVSLTGRILRQDAPDLPGIDFLNLQNSGTDDKDDGWVSKPIFRRFCRAGTATDFILSGS